MKYIVHLLVNHQTKPNSQDILNHIFMAIYMDLALCKRVLCSRFLTWVATFLFEFVPVFIVYNYGT